MSTKPNDRNTKAPGWIGVDAVDIPIDERYPPPPPPVPPRVSWENWKEEKWMKGLSGKAICVLRWHGIVKKSDAKDSLKNGKLSISNRGVGKKTIAELHALLGLPSDYKICPCCGQVVKNP
jgi:hypothetical protein